MALAGACGEASPEAAQTGGTGGGGASGSGGAATDGGAGTGPCSGQTCTSDQFCDWQYDYCREEKGYYYGACMSRSGSCEQTPVCACDHQVYPSQCAARAAGQDLSAAPPGLNPCPEWQTPAGTFPCGAWYCDGATSYCEYRFGDMKDRHFECLAFPAACNGVGTCACLPIGYDDCKPVKGNGVTGLVVSVWSL